MAEPATAGPPRRSDHIRSLERGLAVLRAFGPERSGLTLSDMARTTGLTRAAARRFLLTLVELGYVTSDGRLFSLSPRVLELGYGYLSGLGLTEVATPHLEELVASVRESSSIAVLDGDDIVYVVRVPTKRIMTVAITLGTRFPAYCTSMGRVLLAALAPEGLAAYLERVELRPLTRADSHRQGAARDRPGRDSGPGVLPGRPGARGRTALGRRPDRRRPRRDRRRGQRLGPLEPGAARGAAHHVPRAAADRGRADQRRPGLGWSGRRGAAGLMADLETQVGIVGAGPAGLVLAHLLANEGIDSVVLEQRSRAYVETRVRAGVLEQGSADLLVSSGVGERLLAEGAVHAGVNLQFDGERHRIDFGALTGRHITVYGQQEVVKDLIAARLAAGGTILFEVDEVVPARLTDDRPTVAFRHGGKEHELTCALLAGCDGFHGVCRPAIPKGVLTEYGREYPFGWLGILAAVAPSTDELIYAYHERGFALHSLRSPELSRLYLQVDPTDDLANWPDDRIWSELQVRLASPGWSLEEGPILEKAITPMRSYVCEPMAHGNLFLAGDAAHIVPPTGAKGMNLAIADVTVLAAAVADWFKRGSGPASTPTRRAVCGGSGGCRTSPPP